jgi:uncharacterized protein YegP (UPF0339 family)
MYFEIVKTTAGWHARIRGGNNETVFATQVYTARQTALNACYLVQNGASVAKIYEVNE